MTVSRPEAGQQQLWALFGCVYHEYLERWYMNEWHFYRAHPFPETLQQRVSHEEAEELLRTRREEIAPYANQPGRQSEVGCLSWLRR